MTIKLTPPPVPNKLLEAFSDQINQEKIFIEKNSNFIFVCGSNSKDSCREKFLEFAEKQITEYYFFKAERIIETIEEKKKDLLTIEDEIARYCDCIMIILESAGAFTELGAFAMSERLSHNVMLINNNQYKDEPSFINYGPIKKIQNKSPYKDCIWSNYREIATSFSEIREKFRNVLYKERRSKFVSLLGSEDAYKKLSPKEKLFLLADFINIFGPIKKKELLGLIATHFKIDNYIDIDTEMGLLNATGIIVKDKSGNQYFMRGKDRDKYFLSYNSKVFRIRNQVFNYYAKSCKDRMKALEGNIE